MAATLPSYITSAKPVPASGRTPWYKSTAPTYAGIFLWFVFWDKIAEGGGLAQGGVVSAMLGILAGALICHGLFYTVPAMLGMKTGLPLYVVGTSTFGTVGGLLMPGLLMGLLQFGWLAVNTYYSASGLVGAGTGTAFYAVCVAWALVAAFMGLKGIQYVAKVATFLPLIPLAVLLIGLVKLGFSAGDFKVVAEKADPTGSSLMMIAYIVGFFATAGAAGVDFGMGSRDQKDVQFGGVVGILVAIIFTAGISLLIVAGAHGTGVITPADKNAYVATSALAKVLDPGFFKVVMIGLIIAAFPGACFSTFIAANSFKTVMPGISPYLSVGVGALVSIALAVTGVAGDLAGVFGIIGASFGPICGAMFADYYLAGRKWPGPRAGFNLAGWGAWLIGFLVGITPNLHKLSESIPSVPCAPVAAFVIGGAIYLLLAKLGLQGETIPMPAAGGEPAKS